MRSEEACVGERKEREHELKERMAHEVIEHDLGDDSHLSDLLVETNAETKRQLESI